MLYYRFIAIILVSAITVQACANKPSNNNLNLDNNNYEVSIIKSNQDPLEPINRIVFSFNSIFDKIIIRPVALLYK